LEFGHNRPPRAIPRVHCPCLHTWGTELSTSIHLHCSGHHRSLSFPAWQKWRSPNQRKFLFFRASGCRAYSRRQIPWAGTTPDCWPRMSFALPSSALRPYTRAPTGSSLLLNSKRLGSFSHTSLWRPQQVLTLSGPTNNHRKSAPEQRRIICASSRCSRTHPPSPFRDYPAPASLNSKSYPLRSARVSSGAFSFAYPTCGTGTHPPFTGILGNIAESSDIESQRSRRFSQASATAARFLA